MTHLLRWCGLSLLLWSVSACGVADPKIRTTIEIDAPIDVVWDILVDFPAYSEWNPYHISVLGAPEEGTVLQIIIRRPDGKLVEIDPHILALEKPKTLIWGGGVKGVFWSVHVFRLEETVDGTTRVIHEEDFHGFGTLFSDLPPDVLEESYIHVNEALKARAEERPRP